MTILYKSATSGETFAVQDCCGGYLISRPLTADEVADCMSDLDDVTIDGEVQDALPDGFVVC